MTKPSLRRSDLDNSYLVDLEPFGRIGWVSRSPRAAGGWRAVNAFMDAKTDRKLRADAIKWLVTNAQSRAADYR